MAHGVVLMILEATFTADFNSRMCIKLRINPQTSEGLWWLGSITAETLFESLVLTDQRCSNAA